MDAIKGLLPNVRSKAPLVHFLTNYVTVNDCANITLACGGSPIMADEKSEVEQISSLCAAVVINIGTVNVRTLSAMLQAGRYANDCGIPIILDPAGAGASDFRNDAVSRLLREVNFTAIKGNISEVKFLSNGIMSTQGVDASTEDLVCEETLYDTLVFSRQLSVMTGSVIMITGPIDIVADSQRGYAIRNGHPMMARVSGTGCMSGAVAGCFLGANPSCALESMVVSTAAMGLCGELAYEKKTMLDAGVSTYRNLMIDAMDKLTEDVLAERAKIQRIF
ncbi:MAG: hydroxyethylthiazole kinase [Lachnospiraceae bacterium]|nr:hydroxyethylthiazole kinase [Lachnospiraceae bacterium]